MATVPARTRYVFGVQRGATARFEIAVVELDGDDIALPMFSSQEGALAFAESTPGFASEGEASAVGFALLELLYARSALGSRSPAMGVPPPGSPSRRPKT